jgi:hypothetical protein
MRRRRQVSEYQQLRRCLNVLVPNPEHRRLLLNHLERTISETVALRERNARVTRERPRTPVRKSPGAAASGAHFASRRRQRKPRNKSHLPTQSL